MTRSPLIFECRDAIINREQGRPKIVATGHDRCIILIGSENTDRWLRSELGDLESLQAVLDDRTRPYYEHRLAT